ncbi:DNA-binding transcriptional regulator, MerR family [Lachnospiraceae bacterium XBB1006]|nr:DNA-binding transcriptional regulator, MerR family [Lachnospiraceae bacterium XBB1006]
MKINEVESQVGITKKNIRFYEEQGLLHPDRDQSNGYRNYSEEDVHILKTIKMLRMMDISIEEIRQLLNDEKTFQDILEVQRNRLVEKQTAITRNKNLCEQMIRNRVDFRDETFAVYLTQGNQMEKEGHAMVDVRKKDQRQKSVASIVAGSVVILFIGIFLGLFWWGAHQDPDIPVWVIFLVTVSAGIPVVGILVALVLRLKEIKGGEENEASKY